MFGIGYTISSARLARPGKTWLDNQERWLSKTYMWLKEFCQGWGEEPHSSFIIARSTTLEERCQGHVGNEASQSF